MAQWQLSTIRSKVRATTGRPDTSMMSDATVNDYINKYYQYVLPKELKIFWGYTYYQFFTEAGVDQYEAPTNFQTLNPQVWADGWPIDWYISPDLFYQDYPQQVNKQTVATTNGILNNYNFNISSFPVLPRSVYVTDGTQIAQDNGAGSFIDPFNNSSPPVGNIDYTTGTVTGLAFAAVPNPDLDVVCTSATYFANRPQGILLYTNQVLLNSTVASRDGNQLFVLRPVPDQVYLIKMQGIQIPAELTSDTDVPFRPDLGPLIAYGASLEIFADYNQMDQYEQTLVQYNRYKDVSMQDTYEEYLYQRSTPAF